MTNNTDLIFNAALAAASFQPRSLVAPEAWVGLIPFSTWWTRLSKPRVLVELGTHTGNSYFSLCQTVAEHGLATQCYAIDTWVGDAHAGHYSDEVFDRVDSHNREHYKDFSTLLRMTFDQAVEKFDDESIDVLHIDGLHTYEAVRHDFETWLPKLVNGAVVLFHDIIVRERGFGVWKYWHELKQTYKLHAELNFSNGLGILRVEKNSMQRPLVDDELEQIFSGLGGLHTYFESLGNSLLQRYKLEYSRQEVAHRDSLLEKIQLNSNAQIEYRDALVAQTKVEMKAINDNANAQIGYRDALLTELRAELKAVKDNADAQIIYRDALLVEVKAELQAVKDNSNAQILYRDEQISSAQLALAELIKRTSSKKELLKMLVRSLISTMGRSKNVG